LQNDATAILAAGIQTRSAVDAVHHLRYRVKYSSRGQRRFSGAMIAEDATTTRQSSLVKRISSKVCKQYEIDLR
jgi:hypothetical protein